MKISGLDPPPDLEDLSEEALCCFYRIQSRLRAAGRWEPQHAIGLVLCASECAGYLSFHREVRGLENIPPETAADLEKTLENSRRIARELLVDFAMVPPERVSLSALVGGVDADVAALCAPLDST